MTGEPWFKPKTYGYGNVPINWKGWAVTFAYAGLVVGLVAAAQAAVISPVWCVVTVLLATAVFIPFIKAKTSGEWRWRWGHDD